MKSMKTSSLSLIFSLRLSALIDVTDLFLLNTVFTDVQESTKGTERFLHYIIK